MANGLTEAALAEVCSLVTDGTHDTPKRVESGYPLIKAKEITGGRIDFETCDQISEPDHLEVISRSKPEFGDTLFAHIGASLGEAAFVNTTREFSIKNVALFKPNPAIIDARYLHYLVISPTFQSLAKGTKTGSAQPFLGLSQLRSHRIQYHRDLSTQRRIAGILSAYDELVENSQRRIQILETMARALYREWFVQFRFPGHEEHPHVASPLGDIPRGWQVTRIGDTWQTVLGGTPSRKKPEFWEGGTIPWINSGKVNDLRITGASELITPLALKKSAAKLMPRGTTVLAITGATLGQVSYLEIETAANQSVVGISDPSELRSEWIYLTMRERIKGIINHASGGAQQHINKEIVNEVQVALPPASLAETFKRLVAPMFRELATLLFQIQNLRRTRDLLLPRLLSGQVELETEAA
jgi:type I restriction enzyme S subunit